MITVKLQGGLGNQMFQYAAGLVLAIENNTHLNLDLTEYYGNKLRRYNLDCFKLYNNKNVIVKEIKNKLLFYTKLNRFINKYFGINRKKYYIETTKKFSEEFFKLDRNTYIDGYWQSEKYFRKYSNVIRDVFTFDIKLNSELEKILQEIQNNPVSVCVHIRRGDYVSNPKANAMHGSLPNSYYHSAINILSIRLNNPKFYFFSDDLDWVKKNLDIEDINKHYVEYKGTSACIDMLLMSNCKHFIIANSSFSWWAAWLGDNDGKIVLAPKAWFAIEEENLQSKDIIPKEWIRI